jgi:class 3 adenylate cyclase/PAS domain-containing protein
LFCWFFLIVAQKAGYVVFIFYYKWFILLLKMKPLLQRFWHFKKNSDSASGEADDLQLWQKTLPTDQDLVRAGALLTRERNFKSLISVFVEQTLDISRVDMAAFYVPKEANENNDLRLYYKRGRFPVPETISGTSELVCFMRDCREAVIFNNTYVHEAASQASLQAELTQATAFIRTGGSFLKEILISSSMLSGMALPIISPQREIGVLFVGSRLPRYFNRRRFHFLDSFTKLVGGAMHNLVLSSENRESLQKIDSLERYQQNVFNSMTNMIVTTDASGRIYYFNEASSRSMGLEERHLGLSLDEVFHKSLSQKTIKTLHKCLNDGSEILGLEGIYSLGDEELDFSLNVTTLKSPRGKKEGLTLLFTNQSREKELKQAVEVVSEERRMIKDMFARYMSHEVVSSLMEAPESLKLGGDKRIATVFFADIRGYTSFSENREPEMIVEILNEYFSAAVEHVVHHRGYIDKFIGDCIMAVWGVPMQPEENDAINAINCALAIQELVRSTDRKFFRNDASHLRVGIGVNSGPLVAGNLGSMQRMDYSVIGDTVNVAARLENIAGPDEIIISEATKNYLGDKFNLEKRPEVRVKGKERALQIYNVLGKKE